MNDIAPDVTPDITPDVTPDTVEAAPAVDAAVVTGDPPAGQSPDAEADWRSRMSGGNEDKLKKLERYGSEQAVVDALMAANQKISSGDMLPKLPDNPTDDDLSAYRKDMGIPETAEGYEYNLPEGFSFGESDKPFLDNALKAMHEKNATPDQINAMLNVYASNVEEQALQFQQKDATDKEFTEDKLRSEYGNDYRANINMVQNFLSTAPEDVQSMLMNGRGPDGTAFMNNPEMVRWLNGVVREVNPAASVVKMTGRDNIQSVNDRIAELKGEMDTDINKWRKSPDKKAEYQKLLSAKEKIDKRNA